MFTLTLPDGTQRNFEAPLDGFALSGQIATSLARRALALKIDGTLVDLATSLTYDAEVAIVTADDSDGVGLLRHDCAHIMAQAVQELFTDTQVTIGPVIENGFYYDFARETPFSTGDFAMIEARMREIVERDEKITREVWERSTASDYFRSIGEHYKAEIIDEIPNDEPVSIYRQGSWLDLCRGPHLPSTGRLGKAFKLTKLAGAYWRGDSRNPVLHRIYGTCWPTQKKLDAYLKTVEEAERRDHRRLGREMDLFHLQEEAQGSIFWHEKGYMLWQVIEQYLRRRLGASGYGEVKTPQILDRKFWEASGHWEKFGAHMFVVPDEVPLITSEGTVISNNVALMALKPMNCPAHVQIFKQGIKSYRDLPIRMAEFGCCHRNEPHGALHGLMRVRQMTQDDAHIFCRADQVIDEAVGFCDLVRRVYSDLGFDTIAVRLALRPEVRVGSDEIWDRAEQGMRDALCAAGLEWIELKGEGAFYGPKIEYHLEDAIGRSWQCGTLQLDFVLPERLNAYYIGADGGRHHPVMLHRAVLGTLERFIGILIEQYEGRFPLWLAPTQAVICPITDRVHDYARVVYETLCGAGLRASIDLRNEKINYKVREHSHAKIPLILAIGAREAEAQSVSVRTLGKKTQKIMPLADAVAEFVGAARPPDLDG